MADARRAAGPDVIRITTKDRTLRSRYHEEQQRRMLTEQQGQMFSATVYTPPLNPSVL